MIFISDEKFKLVYSILMNKSKLTEQEFIDNFDFLKENIQFCMMHNKLEWANNEKWWINLIKYYCNFTQEDMSDSLKLLLIFNNDL